jgi:MSHA biogenesis protein MshM
MIRSHFGLQRNPFDTENLSLLAHQQEVFDILRVHAQQGGLCLVLGEPGTGKSVLKQALLQHDPKRMITPVVNRTLHTYHNTLRILCEAFQIEFEGRDHRCERLLVQQAFSVHRAGKMLVPIIDDAHLMPTDCLRKLRLLCEDFPRSHNLVLIGQPPLMQSLTLSINEEIRSRVTYSALLPRLNPEAIEQFILDQLDRAGLGHNTFSPAICAWARSLRPSGTRPASWTSNTSTASSSSPTGEKTMTTHSPQPRWSREQIRAARVAPLLPLLQKRGLQSLEQAAGNFLLPAFPGLIIKDSYWRWPQRDRAGNTIDFFVQVLGLSFHQAMRQILGDGP